MRTLELREFIDHFEEVAQGAEPVAVERDGRTVGFYTPTPRISPEESRAAFERLDAAIERALVGGTMTREELADALDLSKPFPFADDEGKANAAGG